MKITILKPTKCGFPTLTRMSVTSFLDSIKTDSASQHITVLRSVYRTKDDIRHYAEYRKIPQVCFQSELTSNNDGKAVFSSYNGLVAIIVNDLHNQFEKNKVKEIASRIPQTFAAFEGGEGQSVIILSRVHDMDGCLPQTVHDAKVFHASAYQLMVRTYSPSLSFPIDIQLPYIDQTFMMPLDPEPYLNERASDFIIEKKSVMPLDDLRDARKKNHYLRLAKGENSFLIYNELMRAITKSAYEQNQLMIPQDKYKEYIKSLDTKEKEKVFQTEVLVKIAEQAAVNGIPQEEAVLFLMLHFGLFTEREIRQEVVNAYLSQEGEQPLLGMPKNQAQALAAEEFIDRRYEFQYNEVKGLLEYRPRQSIQFLFKELTNMNVNTICHEAAIEGTYTTDAAIKRLIYSDRVAKYNPINDFLDNLPRWDGKDRIRELMEMVPTDNPYWLELGSRWFLSMVSHWLNPYQNHANSTAPILIGGQALRKSTYCKNILPPQLSEFYTDSIDFRNDIEAERFLSRFMLINIDEFDQLSPSQFAYIKHMFQKTQTAHRELFKENISNHPRYASFIGTSNCYDILKDPTGNRRFLCVEVKDVIPTERPIDYPQLYAQAVAMINDGERCFINDADEALIKKMNGIFEEVPLIEQLFDDAFERPADSEGGSYMRPLDIIQILKGNPKYDKSIVSEEKLGRTLTKLGFKKKQTSKGTGYFVKPKYKV